MSMRRINHLASSTNFPADIAAGDDELATIKKTQLKMQNARKLNLIFTELDESGDGMLSWPEFETF